MTEVSCCIVTLGCAKNEVDSSSMAQLIDRAGYLLVGDPSSAEVVIVNTCGFIAPAREESYEVLADIAGQKVDGQVLIAAGCLTQRYGAEVAERVPGIDAVIGTRRWMDIAEVLRRVRSGSPVPLIHLPDEPGVNRDDAGTRRVSVSESSAYLKIADGCRRPCAFCAIPLIKGSAVSRPPEAIVGEALELQNLGVREVVLIAQDTTDYGRDLGLTDGLATLLTSICDAAPDLCWIRLMYAYPGYVTDRLIEVMAARDQILPYLDMPLQHAHPETLRRMRRPANMSWVRTTIESMRAVMPDLALRTTFIVGYPGETEEEFEELEQFVKEMRFDRVGVFEFSFEKGTGSEALGDPVAPEVKAERRERLMNLQQSISLGLNRKQIGKTLDVLTEGRGDGITVGRSYRDAPEVDGLVLVEPETEIGIMVPVLITRALTYDLVGTLAQDGLSAADQRAVADP